MPASRWPTFSTVETPGSRSPRAFRAPLFDARARARSSPAKRATAGENMGQHSRQDVRGSLPALDDTFEAHRATSSPPPSQRARRSGYFWIRRSRARVIISAARRANTAIGRPPYTLARRSTSCRTAGCWASPSFQACSRGVEICPSSTTPLKVCASAADVCVGYILRGRCVPCTQPTHLQQGQVSCGGLRLRLQATRPRCGVTRSKLGVVLP